MKVYRLGGCTESMRSLELGTERDFRIDTLLIRNCFIVVMIRLTGLVPWELEFPFHVALHLPSFRRAAHSFGITERIGAFGNSKNQPAMEAGNEIPRSPNLRSSDTYVERKYI